MSIEDKAKGGYEKMKKAVSVLASSIILASCGGGGGGGSDAGTSTNFNNSNTGSLTGQFVDAPVVGLEYETTSGVKGETDENGYFTYNPNDEITFRIGNLVLGKTKGADVITPATLLSPLAYDEAQFTQRLKEFVALLLSLDDDSRDNIIRINNFVKEKFRQLQETIEFLNSNLQNVSVDVDNDGQEDNLYTLIQNKLTDAQTHFGKSMINKVVDFILDYVKEKNVKCGYSTDYSTGLRVDCQDGFSAFFSVQDGVLKVSYPDGNDYTVSKIDNGEICIYKNGSESCSVVQDLNTKSQNEQENNTSQQNFDYNTAINIYQNMTEWGKKLSFWEVDATGYAEYTYNNCFMKYSLWNTMPMFDIDCNGSTVVLTGYDTKKSKFYLYKLNENTNQFEEKNVIDILRTTLREESQVAEICFTLDNGNDFCIETQ